MGFHYTRHHIFFSLKNDEMWRKICNNEMRKEKLLPSQFVYQHIQPKLFVNKNFGCILCLKPLNQIHATFSLKTIKINFFINL